MSGDAATEAFHAALLDDDPVALYERAPCGYLSMTPDGTIVKANQTFLTWTGYHQDDLVGRRRLADLLTAGGRIYHETHYAPMLRMQGHAREIALDIVAADGRRLPAFVSAVLESDDDGEPVVVRAAVFHAAERREYERELLRAKERAEASEAHAALLARTLQQTLIPPAPPHVAGLDVAAAYRPAGTGEEIGGDFYDVFELGPDDWVFAVGDVRGKGVDAAVITALVRYSIRAAAVRHPEPSRVLDTLNEVLCLHETDRFCTVAIVRLRRHTGRWTATVSCGGHPLPLLASRGAPPRRVAQPGALLGVFDAPSLSDTDVALAPGDTLLLYTDGITEGRRRDEWFGEARLEAAMVEHAGTARSLTEGLLDDVLVFQGGISADDIVLVAVHVPDE